jgi:hypothetical protein
MKVAHVLADSSPGWDIHAKSGGGGAKRDDDDDDNDDDDDENDDSYADHWVRYYDEASEQYFYYHRETNITQWDKPEMGSGVVLLGMVNGTEREYANEGGGGGGAGKGGIDNQSEQGPKAAEDGIAAINDTSYTKDASTMETSDFVAREVLDQYKDAFLRWNHPYRIPERTDVRENVTFDIIRTLVSHFFHLSSCERYMSDPSGLGRAGCTRILAHPVVRCDYDGGDVHPLLQYDCGWNYRSEQGWQGGDETKH